MEPNEDEYFGVEYANSLSSSTSSTRVHHMHYVPRFGYSNDIASFLASPDPRQQKDYIDGLVSFALLLLVFVLIWSSVLIVARVTWGPAIVGCAAGGSGPIHVSDLRRQGVTRRQRVHRILRQWRLQSFLCATCLSVPTISMLLLNHGWYPVIDTLNHADAVSQYIDVWVKEAIEVGNNVSALTNILEEAQDEASKQIQTVCPNYEESSLTNDSIHLGMIRDDLQSTLWNVITLIDYYNNDITSNTTNPGDRDGGDNIKDMVNTLAQVTDITHLIHHSIEWMNQQSWMLKGFLITANILDAMMFLGVILTKNSIHCVPYQFFLMFCVVPLWCYIVAVSVIIMGLFATTAMMNADYCSGGSLPGGSPLGTMSDVLTFLGHPVDGVPQQAMTYYAQTCSGSNPFQFLSDFEEAVQESETTLQSSLLALMEVDQTSLEVECGKDNAIPAFEALVEHVVKTFTTLRGTLVSTQYLTNCARISPHLATWLNVDGDTCTSSVTGTAWLFAMSITFTVAGLLILSTRAALYSTVIRPRRIKRREKEFEEYKLYMSSYYDTSGWKLDPGAKNKDDVCWKHVSDDKGKGKTEITTQVSEHDTMTLLGDVAKDKHETSVRRSQTFDTEPSPTSSSQDDVTEDQSYRLGLGFGRDSHHDRQGSRAGVLSRITNAYDDEADNISYYSSDSADSEPEQSVVGSVLSSASSAFSQAVSRIFGGSQSSGTGGDRNMMHPPDSILGPTSTSVDMSRYDEEDSFACDSMGVNPHAGIEADSILGPIGIEADSILGHESQLTRQDHTSFVDCGGCASILQTADSEELAGVHVEGKPLTPVLKLQNIGSRDFANYIGR